MDARPVGMFDSGVGGVSVLGEAIQQLPYEDFIYFGDNAHAPYGSKTEAEIVSLTFDCAHRLMQYDVKAMVIACNTATSAAINEIRQCFRIPVISMEPAVKPACACPGNGRVLMLATPATIAQPRYRALVQRQPSGNRVIDVPCPELAGCIERNGDCGPLLEQYLFPFAGETVDAIVLGCTHYVFVRDEISAFAQNRLRGACRIFDGNEGTIGQLARILADNALQNHGGGAVRLLTSGDPNVFLPRMQSLLQRSQAVKTFL